MTEYLFPDDVIIESTASGRSARIAYKITVDHEQGVIAMISDKPVIFDPVKLQKALDALHALWIDGRERYREVQRKEFLARYPAILEEQASYEAFREKTGDHSITAWRKWMATR